MSWMSWLPQLTFPGCCVVCGAWCVKSLCMACRNKFLQPAIRCQCCGEPQTIPITLCGRCVCNPPAFRATWVALDYAYPWDQLIRRYKYGQSIELGSLWVDLMAHARAQACSTNYASKPHLIVPVPLSKHRLKQRGYNQAWELARCLADNLGCPVLPQLLVKQRDTPEQASLDKSLRVNNVRGSFAVNSLERRYIQDRDVVVVDDVMTTGATGQEIASVLRLAGAASVTMWVLARTPRNKNS